MQRAIGCLRGLMRRTAERIKGKRVLIEEERVTECQWDRWYPVFVGEVFSQQYEVVAKLGWGATSTVWLVQDHQ